MKATKARSIKWTSDLLDTISHEVAELSHRYLVELYALKQHSPGSDDYINRWAEMAVQLEWLQMKIKDLLQEMECLEETWPD